ncbi:helix-turn-helix domain-containing protein [Staphylococcus equorum]|uniref:helix-turn-helix domain-containing protein n=1 Tax=Staphylococcus equorum TaxID=246432 RepID=UPI003CF56A8B
MNKNSLGMYLNKLRLSAGISARELSRKADLSQSYLSNIEKGIKNNPSPKALNKIAIALSNYGLDKDNVLYELLKRTTEYEDDEITKSFVRNQATKNSYKNAKNYFYNSKGELQESQPVPQKNMLDLRDILDVKNHIGTKYTFEELDREHTITLGKNIKQQILNVVDELVKLHVYNNPELLNNDEADNENVDWKISTNKLRIIEQQDVSNKDSDD